MIHTGRVLVVDDQQIWIELFDEILCEIGLKVVTASNYDDAIRLLDTQSFDVAVIDVRLDEEDPQNIQGMEILAYIDQIGIGNVLAKIVITGYGTRDWVRESFKKYAVDDFIPKQGPEGKGFDAEDFVISIQEALMKGERSR